MFYVPAPRYKNSSGVLPKLLPEFQILTKLNKSLKIPDTTNITRIDPSNNLLT
jgi:hypothetical protein